MIFTQPLFYFFFFAVYWIYWAIPSNRVRKHFLLAMSYVFYSTWDWRFCGLIVLSTVIDYTAGRMLGRTNPVGGRRTWISLSVCANLGILGFFKYFNFFIDSANDLIGVFGFSSFSTLNLILPVGISFYTFQTMSYTLDVYRGTLKPLKNFTDFALFVSFFPQLVAGPIVRASSFLPQLEQAKQRKDVPIKWALTLFAIGFLKKACVADNIAVFIDPIFADPTAYNVSSMHMAYLFYAVQVYCDFSGYTDMAIAVSGMLGYHIPINFAFPYLARNQVELWRRWHISFITWIRDYLFIPLGGSRGSNLRTYMNLMTTFILSGLWHGADWTMIIWGALHGIVLVGYRMISASIKTGPRMTRLLHWPGVFATTFWFAWTTIYFRGESVEKAWAMTVSTITGHSDGVQSIPITWLWAIIPLYVCHWLAWKIDPPSKAEKLPDGLYYFLLGFASVLMLMFIRVEYQPFIYFQF